MTYYLWLCCLQDTAGIEANTDTQELIDMTEIQLPLYQVFTVDDMVDP